VAFATGLIAAVLAPSALAQTPAASVDADGNLLGIPEPLRFDPKEVTVPLGGVVRWTNTDFLVPHTATEDHGLWNLTGTFNPAPGLSPPGFGPGETRARPFAAGTWSYFCEVHPVDMRGTVTVPLTLGEPKKGKKKGKKKAKGRAVASARKKGKRKTRPYQVPATWSLQELPPGQVFDIERSRNGGPFAVVKDGIRELGGVLKAGRKGTTISVRVRVRATTEPARTSGYSPVATITVD